MGLDSGVAPGWCMSSSGGRLVEQLMAGDFWMLSGGDRKPCSDELKSEGEFLDSGSLAIKGLASKASGC